MHKLWLKWGLPRMLLAAKYSEKVEGEACEIIGDREPGDSGTLVLLRKDRSKYPNHGNHEIQHLTTNAGIKEWYPVLLEVTAHASCLLAEDQRSAKICLSIWDIMGLNSPLPTKLRNKVQRNKKAQLMSG